MPRAGKKLRPPTIPPRPAHRPSLLTPDVHRKIVDLVRGGNFPETAAAAAGVSKPTLRMWMREGAVLNRDDPGRKTLSKRQRALKDFLFDLDKAFGEAEARDVLLIGKLAENDWRAAAWRLERRNRAQWAPLQKVESTVHVSSDGGSKEWVLERLRRMVDNAPLKDEEVSG